MATKTAPQQPLAGAAVQEKTAGPLFTPLTHPAPSSKPAPRPALTADEQEKYDWLLNQVRSWTEIPSKKSAGPITDSERFWLTRECLLRFLRATKWQPKETEKRLLETLAWRREYGVEDLTADHISPENETGKQVILGYDKEGRVCHYLNPGRQNTDPGPRQVQHLVFMLERVIDVMPAGQETLSLLINFKSSKSRSNTAPGLGLAREVLNILQSHYPERLGRALIINVPWIVNGFFKLITPFIDPHTRDKLKFNEDMTQYVPREQLWTEFHGSLEFEYDHARYWPALIRLCSERHEARRRRWIDGGSQIGELEDYLAGQLPVGVSGSVVKEGGGEEEKKEDVEDFAAVATPRAEEPVMTTTAEVVVVEKVPGPAVQAAAEVAPVKETV